MSSPSISVMNCGKALSRASTLRQSWLVCQYCASCWTVASRTPCDSSATVSFSGQRVAAMRRRRSTSASSGTLMRKGRIVLSSAAAAEFPDKRLTAPAAAEVARTSRRVGDVSDMTFSFVARIRFNRKRRTDTPGVKVNLLDDGVVDTFVLVVCIGRYDAHFGVDRHQGTIDLARREAHQQARRRAVLLRSRNG